MPAEKEENRRGLLPWLLVLFALQFSSAYAVEVDAEAQPDADLLEFLGEWETADGTWFDPLPDDVDTKEEQEDES
jgi:hypothetical protein